MACQLVGKTESLKSESLTINIIKLTMNGFLANTLAQTIQVNGIYGASFVLPSRQKEFIESEVLVLKTYDEFKGIHGLVQPGNHVTEFAFRQISPDNKNHIYKFLALIQKK